MLRGRITHGRQLAHGDRLRRGARGVTIYSIGESVVLCTEETTLMLRGRIGPSDRSYVTGSNWQVVNTPSNATPTRLKHTD